MAQRSIVGRDRRRFSLANAYKAGASSKNQIINVTDVIAEGPIEGLVNSTNSVFLDGDPVTDTASEGGFVAAADEVLTISYGTGASVQATLSRNTALNDLEETADDIHRYMFVYDVHQFRAKVIKRQMAGTTSTGAQTSPYIILEESVAGANAFYLTHVSKGGAITHANHRMRIQYNNEEMDTYMENVLTSSNVVKTDGAGPRGKLIPMGRHGRGNHTLITETEEEETAEVIVKVDAVFQISITTVSGNKVITFKNDENTPYGVSNKKFSLSSVLTQEDKPKKVKNSTVQIRTGTEFQAPLKQLAGVGTTSLAISLNTSFTSAFSVTGRHWRSNNHATYGGPYFRDEFSTKPHDSANWQDNHAAGSGTGSPDSGDGFDKGSSRITLETKSIKLSSTGLTAAKISEIDQLRIQIRFPSGLYHLDNGGNTSSHAAGHQVHVYIKRDGAWLYDLENKYVSDGIVTASRRKVAFSLDHVVPLEDFQPFEDLDIQVTRLTPTGQDNTLSDDEYEASSSAGGGKVQLLGNKDDNNKGAIDGSQVASITATIKEKLNYPFTALGSITFNSEDYQATPVRSYLARGKKIRIPSNYVPRHLSMSVSGATDATKPIYNRLWDGTFSNEGTSNPSGLDIGYYYTDNPAWVFYDMLTHERYGLGSFINDIDIDKYALYKIAKYCDELVPDGKGGKEPRFRANIYLTKATDSYKVLKDMATIFRGMLYWLDGELLTVQDAPSTPIYNFGPANIIDGQIEKEGTGSQTRPNQMVVTWNNPASGFKLEPIIVEDRKNIIETGRVIKEDAVAFGCTSEGQAIRYGKWKLWTAVNQTEIISFKTGLNAAFLNPGDIINVQNDKEYGVTFSGRVSTHSTTSGASVFTLDRNISTESGGIQVDGGEQDRSSYTFNNTSEYTFSALVEDRKVVLLNESATISGTTYKRGDEIDTVFLPTSNGNYVSTTIDMTQTDDDVRAQIALARDTGSIHPAIAGNDILLSLVNSTNIETRRFDSGDISVSNGKTVLTIDTFGGIQSDTFAGTVTDKDSVWVIKEIANGSLQDYSYREYKVLGIAESEKGDIAITAAEFSNNKFDAVDREFLLDVPDNVYTAEETVCPAPPNLYVLRVPSVETHGDEVILQWEHPLDKDGAEYDAVTGYSIEVTGDSRQVYEIKDSRTYTHALSGLGNGRWTFSVRAITAERKSRFITRSIEIFDIYGTYNGPRIADAAVGVQCDWKDAKLATNTFKMFTKQWIMKSVADVRGAPLTNSANGQATTASWQQDVSGMQTASIKEAYILFNRDGLNYDYLKLVHFKEVNFDNTALELWYDVSNYVSGGVAENNRWTHVDCNISIPTGTSDNIVTRTGGSTGFFTGFEIGDIIRIQSGTSGGNPVYIAAKVASIESDDKLVVDRKLNNTTSILTVAANSTNKTVAKNHFKIDPIQDGIIATITRDNTDYDFINHLQELPGIRGRAVTAYMDVPSITYDKDEALSPANQLSNGIKLFASAINFINPVFKVTGDFYGSGGGSNDTSFTDPATDDKYEKVINDSTAIPYSHPAAGAAQVFTVTVQEAEDATREVTTTVNLPKLKQGQAGNSTGIVFLYAVNSSSPTRPVNVSGFPSITVNLEGANAGKVVTGNSSVNSSGQVINTSNVGLGWYTTPQTPSTGQTQWVVAATANGTGSTDAIASSEWSIPAKFSGDEGLSGFNSRVIELYTNTSAKLTTTGDTDHSWCPTQDKTLTFANTTPLNSLPTSTKSGSTVNWYYTIAAALGANGITEVNDTYKYVYKTTAMGISRSATYTIDGNDSNDCYWSTPALVIEKGGQGQPGSASPRTVTGHVYYNLPVASITGLGPDNNNSGCTYNFTNGTISGMDANWSLQAPPADPDNTQKKFWYASYSATESGSNTGSGPVTFGTPYVGLNFTALVTFNALDATDGVGTTIHGGNITTGIIRSTNTDISGTTNGSTFATGISGASQSNFTYFNLTSGALATKNFRIGADGSAEFKGTLSAASFSSASTMTGASSLTIGASSGARVVVSSDGSNNAKITIYDSNGVRVKLGYLGT